MNLGNSAAILFHFVALWNCPLKGQSRLSISNITSVNVSITTTLVLGQFCNIIGDVMKLSVNGIGKTESKLFNVTEETAPLRGGVGSWHWAGGKGGAWGWRNICDICMLAPESLMRRVLLVEGGGELEQFGMGYSRPATPQKVL